MEINNVCFLIKSRSPFGFIKRKKVIHFIINFWINNKYHMEKPGLEPDLPTLTNNLKLAAILILIQAMFSNYILKDN